MNGGYFDTDADPWLNKIFFRGGRVDDASSKYLFMHIGNLLQPNPYECVAYDSHGARNSPRSSKAGVHYSLNIQHLRKPLQGPAKVCFPGSANMRWKSCVLLPAAGRRTQCFLLIFMEPGVTTALLEHFVSGFLWVSLACLGSMAQRSRAGTSVELWENSGQTSM